MPSTFCTRVGYQTFGTRYVKRRYDAHKAMELRLAIGAYCQQAMIIGGRCLFIFFLYAACYQTWYRKTAEGAMAANTRVLSTVSLGHFEDLMTFVYGFWLLCSSVRQERPGSGFGNAATGYVDCSGWRSIGGPVTRLWFLPHC